MTRAAFTILTILLLQRAMFSQPYDKAWLAGYDEFPGLAGYGHVKIRFQDGTVTSEQTVLAFNFESTMAAVSDTNGNLLFYTNGCEVANRDHQAMPNGLGLNPGGLGDMVCPWKGYTVPQGAMVLPAPGHSDHFYLLHMGGAYDPVRKLQLGPMYFSLVDMALQNGLGDVVSKNTVLLDGDLGSFTAVRHGNGRDWWVVVPEFGNKVWHTFLLSPQGIEMQTVQDVALVLSGCEKHMATATSPDGRKLANWGDCKITVLDFDRCSGNVSNLLELDAPTHWVPGGGVAFSPSGRYLYATSQNVLFRADLETGTPKLDTMRYSYDPFNISPYYLPGNTFHSLTNGPDGFIYGNFPARAKHLHTLKNPDAGGIADINFQAKAVSLPVTSVRTLPHFPNFRLYDLPNSPCDTLGINGPIVSSPEPERREARLRVQPNPASETVTISLAEEETGRVTLTDLTGKIWREHEKSIGTKQVKWDTAQLPAGIYMILFQAGSGKRESRKLVVMH